jgi:hypothetical protein
MPLRTWLVDVATALGISVLAYLVVQFSRGPGIQFVYFAF